MTLRVHPLAAENHRPSLTLAQHSLAWLPDARSEDVAKASSGLKGIPPFEDDEGKLLVESSPPCPRNC